MKKYLFLFAMMFMTSVSAYSYEHEFTRDVEVDVAMSYHGSAYEIWFPRNQMSIHYDGRGLTTVTLELWGWPVHLFLDGRENSVTLCMRKMERYLNGEFFKNVLPGHLCMIRPVGGFPKSMYK